MSTRFPMRRLFFKNLKGTYTRNKTRFFESVTLPVVAETRPVASETPTASTHRSTVTEPEAMIFHPVNFCPLSGSKQNRKLFRQYARAPFGDLPRLPTLDCMRGDFSDIFFGSEFDVGIIEEYLRLLRDLNWYVDTFRQVYLSKHKRKPKKTILKPLKNRKKCSSKVILFFKKQIVLTLNRA
ncbi:hypothetical protein HF325_005119 [Metschnikowia pulcherrima]|uniref:Uncharacterized protein n=1 Tax=Metschnikowia pulcherrima TaxID=27326 RepID=A0A8H7GND4_9ASCO|nr:hypothetical protein HF325_005119 [Metschnikowia pulcherrima]